MRHRFGDCILDTDARELRRGGRPRRLSPKALQLLALLVEAAPRAVPQAELRDRIWPRTHVARTSLARLVTEIRQAIGDTARESRYLRNVHGFGYAFRGEGAVDRPGGPPAPDVPALLWGGREYALAEGENVIGRSAECGLTIDSPQVSRRHARVFVAEGHATIEDLGSKNGTFLGGRKVLHPSRLADGDQVVVGPALLVFRAAAGAETTRTQSRGRDASG